MNRNPLLEQGRKCCDALLAQHPEVTAPLSISRQIDYLIGLESGSISDRSRLKEITIGVLTAREIEPLDDEAAEIFYKISSEASRM
ncbi:immunity protein Tsi6 family protein [Chitiniphilus shinanonensis]|uniref:immunity protein Tsi6 family protein n=1 Tax=Chitiniphilus shinanonensis TaxID=553088 RepID=UPI00146B9BE3